MKPYFYMLSLHSLLALEAFASERSEALSKLSLSHEHYFKSCFAYERGDVAKAKDELRLAQVLDENSSYLRWAMRRQEAAPSASQERLQGELSSAEAHSRQTHVNP